MSIAGGFFGRMSENIGNQRDYIRARVDEDRTYLRQQGLKRQAGIQEKRGAYEKAAGELVRRGADPKAVRGLLEMDPAGLMQIHATKLQGAELQTSFLISEDYEGEASMSEILAKIVPTMQSMPKGSTPEAIKRKSLGAFLGLDLDTELNEEVYGQQVVGGMTGDDIMSSIGSPISVGGSNPAGVTYNFATQKALSKDQRAGLIASANSDYTKAAVEAFRKTIETLKADEGETPDELTARKLELGDLAEAFNDATGVDRLSIGIRLLGPKASTTAIYQEHGSSLFNSQIGFGATTLAKLESIKVTAPSTNDGEGIKQVSSVAEAQALLREAIVKDPETEEITVNVAGNMVVVATKDLEEEPEAMPEGVEGLSSSLRPIARPDLEAEPEAMPGLGDRRAARNEGMEPSVEPEGIDDRRAARNEGLKSTSEKELKAIIAKRKSLTDSLNKSAIKLDKTIGDAVGGTVSAAIKARAWVQEGIAKATVALTGNVNSASIEILEDSKELRKLAEDIVVGFDGFDRLTDSESSIEVVYDATAETLKGLVDVIKNWKFDTEKEQGSSEYIDYEAAVAANRQFVDGIGNYPKPIQTVMLDLLDEAEEGSTEQDRIDSNDKQFIADDKNYPQPQGVDIVGNTDRNTAIADARKLLSPEALERIDSGNFTEITPPDDELKDRIAAYEKKYNIGSYVPPTMTASDLNTPKVRSSLASKRGN